MKNDKHLTIVQLPFNNPSYTSRQFCWLKRPPGAPKLKLQISPSCDQMIQYIELKIKKQFLKSLVYLNSSLVLFRCLVLLYSRWFWLNAPTHVIRCPALTVDQLTERRPVEDSRASLLNLTSHVLWNGHHESWLRLSPAAVWLSSTVTWTTANWDHQQWPVETPFSFFLQGFKLAPLVAMRTVKEEIVSGLEIEKAAWAQGQDAEWMVLGRYGVVQFFNDITDWIN